MLRMPSRYLESFSRSRRQHELLFLGVVLEVAAFFAAGLELLHALDLLLDRLVVGEQTAEPALGDEQRAGALGFGA